VFLFQPGNKFNATSLPANVTKSLWWGLDNSLHQRFAKVALITDYFDRDGVERERLYGVQSSVCGNVFTLFNAQTTNRINWEYWYGAKQYYNQQ
jgi:hypothetical protein